MKLLYFYLASVQRDVRKTLRQRDRLAASLVRPLLWLWVIGGGMAAMAGPHYIERLVPGIIGMSLLFGAMVGGLSIAFDKDAGTMRLLVTAPVGTSHVIGAKIISATLVALLQTLLLMAVLATLEAGAYVWTHFGLPLESLQAWLPWAGTLRVESWPWFALATGMGGLVCACLGVWCAVIAKSIDSFAVMMNFVIFPVFFFSGAMYPTHTMPVLARWVSQINPFTYVVDMLRAAVGLPTEYGQWISAGYLFAACAIIATLAIYQFTRHGGALVIVAGKGR